MQLSWRRWLKRDSIGIAIIFAVILIYGIFIEPYHLKVKNVWICDTVLSRSFSGKVVVQLSDLHIGKIGRRELKILDMLRDTQPDYIFLTGDYVKWKGDYEKALQFLTMLEAKDGIYAVMGDYDYSNSRHSCLFCHEITDSVFTMRKGIHFLRNSSIRVMTDHGSFWIGGLDREEGEPIVPSRYFPFLRDEEAAIVLCHSPLIFDVFRESDHVVILSGDTHGGQIPIPAWLLKIMGYEKNLRYNQGLFIAGTKKMYVSRGIGTSHFPVRLFRQPEIVVVHFKE